MPKTKFDNEFGNRLAVLRKKKGMTQKQLGEAIGASQRIIAYYESQTPNVPANLLPRLAETLQVSIETLLGMSNAPKEDNRNFDARLIRKLSQLSDQDKKTVSKVVDALLAK